MKPLKQRLSKSLLAKLKARKITNKDAAMQLNVHENTLSRTVSQIQTKDPGKTTTYRKNVTQLAQIRQKVRDELAKSVIKGKLTAQQAAEKAGCTERTIYRHVAKYRPT